MFKKIAAPRPTYTSKFVKVVSDLDDSDKIEKELAEIKSVYPTNSLASAADVRFNGRMYSVKAFSDMLKDTVDKLQNKQVKDVYKSTLFGNLNYFSADPEIFQDQLQRDLASLERQIVERENNLIDIDTYVMQLVTNKEGARLNLQHTHAKFIKIAEDDMVKEADEVIEDYYNELYDESEGSPDFGTALEHPEETNDELTTEIHHHKFKKK